MSARFGVTTVTGFSITPRLAHVSGEAQPGLSAHVIDRFNNCHVVASYRSEDRRPVYQGGRFGHDGAIRAAHAHAAYLEERYGGMG